MNSSLPIQHRGYIKLLPGLLDCIIHGDVGRVELKFPPRNSNDLDTVKEVTFFQVKKLPSGRFRILGEVAFSGQINVPISIMANGESEGEVNVEYELNTAYDTSDMD